MSWSVDFTGTSKALAAALDTHSETLTGACRTEYDSAKPHLIALVRLNFNDGYAEQAYRIVAGGHGYKVDGRGYGNCNVAITSVGRVVAEPPPS